MRIGHQIYNYLNDFTDDGSYSLFPSIMVENNDQKHYITRAYINWNEDQVYLVLVTDNVPFYLAIPQVLKWLGGSQKPQSYKPLYQLRDQLKTMAKKRYMSMKHTTSQTITYYRTSQPFK